MTKWILLGDNLINLENVIEIYKTTKDNLPVIQFRRLSLVGKIQQ